MPPLRDPVDSKAHENIKISDELSKLFTELLELIYYALLSHSSV